MQPKYLISIGEFCARNDIEISFVNSLQSIGLIEIKSIENNLYIDAKQLQLLEKFVQFHYELDINIEGIETITHLLQRVNYMHDEITVLRNRLSLYE